MAAQKDCFVIMPFSATKTRTEAEWTETFDLVLRPAIKACGYSCERASPMTGRLAKGIIERLRNAYLVLADITDRNANVFYELGVRHSLSNRTIIVAQGPEHAPSDLGGYWFTVYGTKPREVVDFKRNIKKLVGLIEKSPEQSDNPVSDYLDQEHLEVSRYKNTENLKKISALITEAQGNLLSLQGWFATFSVSRDGISSREEVVRTTCLDLLLTTYYIDPGPEVLKRAYELRSALHRFRFTIVPELLTSDESVAAQGFDGLVFELISQLRDALHVFEDLGKRLIQGQSVEAERVSFMAWSLQGHRGDEEVSKGVEPVNVRSFLVEADMDCQVRAVHQEMEGGAICLQRIMSSLEIAGGRGTRTIPRKARAKDNKGK